MPLKKREKVFLVIGAALFVLGLIITIPIAISEGIIALAPFFLISFPGLLFIFIGLSRLIKDGIEETVNEKRKKHDSSKPSDESPQAAPKNKRPAYRNISDEPNVELINEFDIFIKDNFSELPLRNYDLPFYLTMELEYETRGGDSKIRYFASVVLQYGISLGD